MVSGEFTFQRQIDRINDKIEEWYINEWNVASDAKAGICMSSEARRQSKDNKRHREMMRVLQLATGVSSSDAIGTERLVEVAAGLRYNDEETKHEFQSHLQKFLQSKYKHTDVTSAEKRRRLGKILVELCDSFSENKQRKIRFRNNISKLILLKEKENIDDNEFYKHVVYTDEPISGLYTAALICQLIETITVIDRPSETGIDLILPDARDRTSEISTWPYPAFESNG